MLFYGHHAIQLNPHTINILIAISRVRNGYKKKPGHRELFQERLETLLKHIASAMNKKGILKMPFTDLETRKLIVVIMLA